jgi:hypothetical protein
VGEERRPWCSEAVSHIYDIPQADSLLLTIGDSERRASGSAVEACVAFPRIGQRRIELSLRIASKEDRPRERNESHAVTHKGATVALEARTEPLMQCYFLDLLRARLKLPCRRLTLGLLEDLAKLANAPSPMAS